MQLFDIISKYLNDKPEMKFLQKIDEKLNMLNKQLQGGIKYIFGFVTFLQLYEKNVTTKKFDQFY